MARGRLLNKKVCDSLPFCALPNDTCRLMATWIIPHLDKSGVFHADPSMVRARVFPRRDDISLATIAEYLDAMEAAGLIVRFEARGDIWQCWPGFAENQPALRADRERTDYPPPPEQLPARIPRESRANPASGGKSAGPMESKLSESNPSEVKVSESRTADTPPVLAAPALPSGIPDPSTLTVAQIKKLKLTSDQWDKLGDAEMLGKGRSGVDHIVTLKTRSTPPAIAAFRDASEKYPLKPLWSRIIQAVGESPDDLKLWGEIVTGYIGMGWNPKNVNGMLEFYARREIPKASGTRGAGGSQPSRLQDSLTAVQAWRSE